MGEGGGGWSQPGSFLFFFHDSSQSRSYFSIRRLRVTSAKRAVRTRSISMLHTHATHTPGPGNSKQLKCFDPSKVESFRIQQCRRRSRLHRKRLRVVKPFLTHFSSLGSFLFLDETPDPA